MKNSQTPEYRFLLNRLYLEHNNKKSDDQRTVEKFGQPPTLANKRKIYDYLEINELNFQNPRPNKYIKMISTTNFIARQSLGIKIPSDDSAFKKIEHKR